MSRKMPAPISSLSKPDRCNRVEIPPVLDLRGVVAVANVADDEEVGTPSTPPGGVMSPLCDSASIAAENLGCGLGVA